MSDSRRARRQQAGLAKGCLIAAIVGVVVLGGLALSVKGTYNELVAEQETVDSRWSGLASQYQRRAELVPQLVEVVRGAAGFEHETLTEVTEARARVGQYAVPPEAPTDPEQLREFMATQQQLGSALSRLLVVTENYPQLRATDAFRDLQVQIEGTENRINVARIDFIEAVRTFNTRVRQFPANFVAGFFGFERYPQLEIEDSQREVPEIDFDFGGGEQR